MPLATSRSAWSLPSTCTADSAVCSIDHEVLTASAWGLSRRQGASPLSHRAKESRKHAWSAYSASVSCFCDGMRLQHLLWHFRAKTQETRFKIVQMASKVARLAKWSLCKTARSTRFHQCCSAADPYSRLLPWLASGRAERLQSMKNTRGSRVEVRANNLESLRLWSVGHCRNACEDSWGNDSTIDTR